MRRALVAGALVIGTVFASGSMMDRSGMATSTVQAAPAAQSDFRISQIRFATEVGAELLPINPRIEFPSETDAVWAVFEYVNYTSGTLTYLVRANDQDYAWGKVPNCCPFSERRVGFKIERKGEIGAAPQTPGILSALGVLPAPANLPGAAYDVFVYLNDVEVGSGGFGIKGVQGSDNGNDNADRGDQNH